MPFAVPPPSRRPAGRGLVLLALTAAVLVGLLAMHGLSPVPMPGKTSTHGSGHGVAALPERHADHGAGHCVHDGGGAGRAHHADATCAAAGIGAPYAPPPPVSYPGLAPGTPVSPSHATGAPEIGRAPPDLAELQLLRI
ncbi:DUF6153 family protein [Streptomyces sp. NPDC006552]|uniref:DUF6153 family protein n=1 Tax=Streptomyces sp. NPDC006552 TaxID=3157179 RepID=UPI0033AE4B52